LLSTIFQNVTTEKYGKVKLSRSGGLKVFPEEGVNGFTGLALTDPDHA
jgi:hypothetical protein